MKSLPVAEAGVRMIIESMGRRKVRIRYRNAKNERKVYDIDDVWPFCFVESKHADQFDAVSKEKLGYYGVYGEELTKLIVAEPSQLKAIREKADLLNIPTWEANIPYVNRALMQLSKRKGIPKGITEGYNHRVWYLDCEWNPVTNRLRVIVVKDSYSDKEYVWFVQPSLELDEQYSKYGEYSYETPARAFPNERRMLLDFLSEMEKQDPDVISGWYVTGADIKTIVERCNKNNIEPRGLSPVRRLRYQFGDWAQPIVGRLCIDLMLAVSKLWELKNGKLSGYKLDDVAYELIGEKKIELPDGHDTYLTNLPLYIHYCRQDVRLLPKLDLKVNALNYYISLQHLVQCDIRSTPFITKMFTCLALQDPDWNRRIPTRPQFEKEEYDGADVMDVEPGVYDNVGILDVKAMYHSNAALHNISWETLYGIDPLTKEITDKHDLYLGALSDVDDFADCGNGTFFTQGKKGLLVRQMDKMTLLRNRFKDLACNDPDNYDKWDTMQYACKSLVASMYGIAGDSKYGLYHPQLAAAITYTSRNTLNNLKEKAEEQGFSVLYGHTDSVFVQMPNGAEDGEEKLKEINDDMAPIEVEFEMFCDRIILMAKNRYAGNIVWTNGVGHPPKLYIKGIEMKQSRMPEVMKSCMKDTIGGILANKGEGETTNALKNLILKVINGEVDPLILCMKGKLERDIQHYKVLSGPSAGAAWANEFLGKGYRKGSFFKVTLDEHGKYIAFDDPKDIESKYNIGFKHLAERFIIKKVEPYYSIMKWDTQPLYNALNGLSTLQWV